MMKKLNPVKFKAVVTSARSSGKGGMGLSLITRDDLGDMERAVLLNFHREECDFLVVPIMAPGDEVVEIEGDAKKLSKSKEYRNHLFRYHSIAGIAEDFKSYYDRVMNKHIDEIKDEINNVTGIPDDLGDYR